MKKTISAALLALLMFGGGVTEAGAATGSKTYGKTSMNCRAKITEDGAWQMTNVMEIAGTSGCIQNWTFYRRSNGTYAGWQNHGDVNNKVRATAEPYVQAVGRAYRTSSNYYWGRTAW